MMAHDDIMCSVGFNSGFSCSTKDSKTQFLTTFVNSLMYFSLNPSYSLPPLFKPFIMPINKAAASSRVNPWADRAFAWMKRNESFPRRRMN